MTKLTIELKTELAKKVERLVNSYTDKNILFEHLSILCLWENMTSLRLHLCLTIQVYV